MFNKITETPFSFSFHIRFSQTYKLSQYSYDNGENSSLQAFHPADLEPNGVDLSIHWLRHQRATVAAHPSRRLMKVARSSKMTPCLVCLFCRCLFEGFLPAALCLNRRLKRQKHIKDSGREFKTLWPQLNKPHRSQPLNTTKRRF